MLTVIASLLLTSCPLPDICGPRVYDITLFPRINGEPVFAYTVPQGAESISYPQITIENISDRLSVNSDTLIPVLSDYTDPFIDIWAFDKDGKLDLKKELSGLRITYRKDASSEPLVFTDPENRIGSLINRQIIIDLATGEITETHMPEYMTVRKISFITRNSGSPIDACLVQEGNEITSYPAIILSWKFLTGEMMALPEATDSFLHPFGETGFIIKARESGSVSFKMSSFTAKYLKNESAAPITLEIESLSPESCWVLDFGKKSAVKDAVLSQCYYKEDF